MLFCFGKIYGMYKNTGIMIEGVRMEQDRASHRNRGGIYQKLISWYKQKRYFTKNGKNNLIKSNAEFILTDNAILEMGNNCTIQNYAFFQLTKPSPHVVIGDNVTIGRHNMITAKSKMIIGSNTIIGGYVQIIDHNHGTNRDDLIRNQKAEIKEVIIGEDCWIGAGVKILCGVNIGNGCIIGSNAVVTKDVPPYSIAVGTPAKVIGVRE